MITIEQPWFASQKNYRKNIGPRCWYYNLLMPRTATMADSIDFGIVNHWYDDCCNLAVQCRERKKKGKKPKTVNNITTDPRLHCVLLCVCCCAWEFVSWESILSIRVTEQNDRDVSTERTSARETRERVEREGEWGRVFFFVWISKVRAVSNVLSPFCYSLLLSF